MIAVKFLLELQSTGDERLFVSSNVDSSMFTGAIIHEHTEIIYKIQDNLESEKKFQARKKSDKALLKMKTLQTAFHSIIA